MICEFEQDGVTRDEVEKRQNGEGKKEWRVNERERVATSYKTLL